MNRTLSAVLLVVGASLLVLGMIESDSIASDVSRLFTDEPTDRALWMILGGSLLAIAGLVGLGRGRR